MNKIYVKSGSEINEKIMERVNKKGKAIDWKMGLFDLSKQGNNVV